MKFFISFDIEDWFHAHNIRPVVSRDEWENCESRVVENTERILALLDKHNTTATFFILGWIAERHPKLVEKIAEAGHEIASHGCNHELLYRQSPDAVRADLEQSLEILRSIVGGPILGYRAPSFSITDWAIDLLADLGFRYDSSSFPVRGHKRYGQLDVPEEARSKTLVSFENGLTEVQLPQLEVPFVGTAIPWAGGGYFRAIPYSVFRYGVRHVASRQPFVFYLHPWDLDPDQPRYRSLPWSYRFRHYTNLDKTAARLDRLLADFEWQPIRDALPSGAQDG